MMVFWPWSHTFLDPLLLSYIVFGNRYALQISAVTQSVYESMSISVSFDKFMFCP